MITLLLIGLGGGAGSILRFIVGSWFQQWAQTPTGPSFPLGTLAVNVLGCLVMGMLAAGLAASQPFREEYRFALTVGLLGGFTTFSTFGYETFKLFSDGQLGWAAINVMLTNALCLIALWAGYRGAERVFGQ